MNSHFDPKTQLDPVCGMTVDLAKVPPPEKRTHKDIDYFFCCRGCAEKFSDDPQMYLDNGPVAPPPATSQHTTGYICPMDPEVWSSGPDSCPICGMALEPANPLMTDDGNPELTDMRNRFRLAALFTLPVFVIAMSEHIPGLGPFIHAEWSAWLQFTLSTPVVLWAGYPFFQRGWKSLLPWHPNMFTLIALGTGAAYLFSLISLFTPDILPAEFHNADGNPGLYFEAAAVIITLVLLGQILELGARGRTGEALRMLLDLSPKTARRIEVNSASEEDIPQTEIAVGDLLRVLPGEAVPTDGFIVSGASAIDEAMVTGESMPVKKSAGDKVIGGTMNGLGAFTMSVTTLGNQSVLSRIALMVSEAQRSRAPIQRIADHVAGIFVPAVILAAIVAFFAWAVWGPSPGFTHGLIAAVSVLIIACPCALGLATPMSIMVGMGHGAKSGILIRNAEVLERLQEVDTIVFDKTGTVTEGKPKVIEIIAVGDTSEEDLLRAAASLEANSEHPLAAAILDASRERNIEYAQYDDFQSITGFGVRGSDGEQNVRLGNAAFMAHEGVEISSVDEHLDEFRSSGSTVIYCAKDKTLMGVLSIIDPVKSTAADTFASLQAQGIETILLSGDTQSTVEAVAAGLSINAIHADALPEDKLDFIKRLRQDGKIVAMVGDGINDAPSLAQADIGIAMGTGTDIAIESADVTLVGGNLDALLRARNLSIATMHNIRQNLFFAFFYNTLGVPLAAGILYPLFGLLLNPMIAAAAMSLSSVSVIANALRLRTAKL